MRSEKRVKKKLSLKKKLAIILGVLIGLILAIGIGGIIYVNSILGNIEKVEINDKDLGINENVEVQKKREGIRNIALFGIDTKDNTLNGRSDSIMILTLDSKNDELKLSSVMRDSRVNIPGRGMDKINHAYAFGGAQLAIKTLNETFNLNIKDFVTVNMNGLEHIIDALGGIYIDIIPGEIEYMEGRVTTPGRHLLNGKAAIAYSRIRYNGGDQKRTERHRNVMNGILDKVKNTSVTKVPGLITSLAPFVSTNMTTSGMIDLAVGSTSFLSKELQTARYPMDGNYKGTKINGVYYTEFDLEATKKQMEKFIYE